MATCANPGCDQPGTNRCSACKTTPYCGPICQTSDWAHHKEECPGHLRKVGNTHLEKAQGFDEERNFSQSLRHADLAATKLKQLKDRPVEDIDEALRVKWNALLNTGRHREALECAKEWYLLWPTKHTHPPAIKASFCLIESCILNKEYFDALLYARTLWETITLSRDSHIPDHLREEFTARGAMELARSLWQVAEHGDMPAEEQQVAGVEAIMLARRALEIRTRLYGADSEYIASSMGALASVLGFFNDVDDDEVPRLLEQAKAIYIRAHGSSSPNVSSCEKNLGNMYHRRAERAEAAHDLNRCVANLQLALSHFRESVRIYRAANRVDQGNQVARDIVKVEEWLRSVTAIQQQRQATMG